MVDILSRMKELVQEEEWWQVDEFQNWNVANTGSGATGTKGPHLFQLDTNATASSTSSGRTQGNNGWARGESRSVINWDKEILWHFRFAHIEGTTNGVSRITFGKHTSDGVAALTDDGIGIIIENAALKGIVHNGTSEETTDLSTTLTISQAYDVTITSDGAGNVEWFLDEVSKGTTANGPTGDSTSNHVCMQFEADNGGDSAAQHLGVFASKIWIAQ